MADEIKFDFAKAQSLLETIEESKQYIDELTNLLGGEINGAGQWWKGESYDAFKEKYQGTGRAKSIIEGLSEKTAEVRRHLGKVAEAKKDWDRNASNYFK